MARPGNGGANADDDPLKEKKRLGGGYGFLASSSSNATSQEAARLFQSGMFGDTPLDRLVRLAKKTQRQLRTGVFDRFVLAGKEESLISKPVSFTLQYRSSEGSRTYPLMALAARVLLSIPVSFAVLKRDFSIAVRLITGFRNRLD